MKKFISLAIILFCISCNSKSEPSGTIKPSQTVTRKNSGKIYPTQKEMEKFDTIIQSRNIQISIIKKDLDSYVLHESWGDNGNHIDKYRNAEITLTIKQNKNILLDTIFRKEQFVKSIGKEFSDIAIFHHYWFKKIHADKIEFFGVITEPETDNTVDFSHYFNFKTKKLEYSESVYNEE